VTVKEVRHKAKTIHKYKTRLKIFSRLKRSSLFCRCDSGKEKQSFMAWPSSGNQGTDKG